MYVSRCTIQHKQNSGTYRSYTFASNRCRLIRLIRESLLWEICQHGSCLWVTIFYFLILHYIMSILPLVLLVNTWMAVSWIPWVNHFSQPTHRRSCCTWFFRDFRHQWALARYVKLRVVHAPRMPGTFSPPPLVSDPDMHHGTCVTHAPECMPALLTSGVLWSRWRGKRSRNFRCMHSQQLYISGKRPMGLSWLIIRIPSNQPL